jgi:carbon monoxide dehydrogenase subunit G
MLMCRQVRKEGEREMQVVEASVVVPLSLEETWDFIFDDPRRAAQLLPDVVAVEDFQMRDDGTPRYRMARKAGPFTMSFVSDYFVFERPYRTVSRALESPVGGNFYTTHEPTAEGTRVRWRWEIEAQGTLVGLLLPVMRPLVGLSLQRDLDALAKAATPERSQPPEEDHQREVAASGAGLARALGWVSIGVGLAAVAAPRPLMKAIGLGDRPNLGRFLGVRDLVLGTGLLRSQNTAAWCRARGIADALDVAFIIGGAVTGAFRRDRAPMGVATGASFSVLSFWLARRLEG